MRSVPGAPAGDDAAPATGSTPAAGAAPLPAVELLADLPPLTADDVLAVPVADGGELPSWLTGPALFEPHPVEAGAVRDALALDRNRGGAGSTTAVAVPGGSPRGVLAVGIGAGTVPDVRSFAAAAVRRAQGLAEAGVRRLVLTHISPRYGRDAAELLAEARAIFPETIIARDGLTIDVPYAE